MKSESPNESLFSAIRLIAIMLNLDERHSPKQMKWFLKLIDNYDLTQLQREVLHSDLKNPPDIEAIHRKIISSSDRDSLLKWMITVINVDKKKYPEEQELLNKIKDLNFEANQKEKDIYFELGKSIVKANLEVQFWKELENTGNFFNRKIRLSFESRNEFNQLSILKNRFVFWGLVIFIVVAVSARVLFVIFAS